MIEGVAKTVFYFLGQSENFIAPPEGLVLIVVGFVGFILYGHFSEERLDE